MSSSCPPIGQRETFRHDATMQKHACGRCIRGAHFCTHSVECGDLCVSERNVSHVQRNFFPLHLSIRLAMLCGHARLDVFDPLIRRVFITLALLLDVGAGVARQAPRIGNSGWRGRYNFGTLTRLWAEHLHTRTHGPLSCCGGIHVTSVLFSSH